MDAWGVNRISTVQRLVGDALDAADQGNPGFDHPVNLALVLLRRGVDTYGINAVKILGTPLFIIPQGASEGANDTNSIGPDRWEVKAVRWSGQVGKAVLVEGDTCTAVWLEGG